MALTFPLARETFFDLLPVQRSTFDCPEQVEIARTGGGEILPADFGPRLWSGEVMLGRLMRAEAAPIQALLSVLRGAGASFLAYDIATPAPQADPDGSGLSGVTPLILALPPDARELRLTGLPVGYVLTAGDYLGFSYGSAPVRRALHRVVSGVVADGTGQTVAFEVTPPLRPGAAVGAVVSLINPVCKARLIPGSVNPGTVARFHVEGISFQFIQTLR